jgi:hypothetical protein
MPRRFGSFAEFVRRVQTGTPKFSLDEQFVQKMDSTEPPTRGNAARYWILARSLYATKSVDFRVVPRNRRQGALGLALAAWQPFPKTAHHIIAHREGATLFAWDDDQVAAAQAALGLSDNQLTVVPEDALRRPTASAAGHAAVLRQTLEGVVGEAWHGQTLAATEWWPDIPTSAEWARFTRTALGRIEEIPSVSVAASWLDTPSGHAANASSQRLPAQERLALGVLVLVLLLPTAWYATQFIKARAAQSAASVRAEELARSIEPSLVARTAALDAQARAIKIAALFENADPLLVLGAVNDAVMAAFKSGTLQLTDWEYRGNVLKFTLTSAGGAPPAATQLVQAFERISWLSDVAVSVDGTRLQISATVKAAEANRYATTLVGEIAPTPVPGQASTITPRSAVPVVVLPPSGPPVGKQR